MKFLTRKTDSGLLLTLLLCGFALLPLIRQTGLPSGYDVLYHVHRVAEMDRSWDAGVFMPRWASAFYFGYGYPVFHYYASATYYLTAAVMTISGINAVNALRAVIVISLSGAGAGMYLFTKPRHGQMGGVLAGLAYVYSPYLLYTEPYARGDYPELLAFALFPWILWRFEKLTHPAASRRQHMLNVILAAMSLGLLVITHNLMALVFTGILFGWLVWLRWIVSWRTWLLMLICALLGIGIAAYFWIPVLLEQDAVQLGNLIEVAELDYRNFFVPLEQLVSFSRRADAGAVNGLLPRYNLGIAAVLLALSGAAVTFFRPTNRRKDWLYPLYFAVLAVVMIFLMTPTAALIWVVLSPLALLQFPWRFLGPVALCLAVLSSANAYWLESLSQRWRMVAFAGMCLLPLVMAIPTLYVPEWDLKDVDTSVTAYQQAEVQGLQRGTTFTGEYLPVDVFAVPGANQRLLDDFADGAPVNKIHVENLPEGARVELLEQDPHHNAWRIQSDAPFVLEVLTFDFPGWVASVNGEPVDITPAVPHGFITFPVPAGDSLVRLDLKNTPPRNIGNIVSALSLVALLGVSYLTSRQIKVPEQNHVSGLTGMGSGDGVVLIGGGLLAGLVFVLVLFLTMRPGVAWLNSEPGETRAAEHVVAYHLGDQIQLIGYDISDTELNPGDRLELALYWYAREAPRAGYAVFVHISTGGSPIAQSDRQNPGGIPTLEWTPDGYIYDSHVIYVQESGLPSGTYQVYVGLWTCDGIPEGEPCGNGLRLDVTDADGDSLGDAIPLTQLTIK